MPNDTSPEWERVLTSAAHLQRILPDAVLVGGTASALYAKHRLSTDADHVLTDLRDRFDHILAQLESVAGWKTARVQRPVQILGSLDGIETGIRQLIRDEPLETTQVECFGLREDDERLGGTRWSRCEPPTCQPTSEIRRTACLGGACSPYRARLRFLRPLLSD